MNYLEVLQQRAVNASNCQEISVNTGIFDRVATLCEEKLKVAFEIQENHTGHLL
jgi:hypothetical protein